jgi:hypothetical protein
MTEIIPRMTNGGASFYIMDAQACGYPGAIQADLVNNGIHMAYVKHSNVVSIEASFWPSAYCDPYYDSVLEEVISRSGYPVASDGNDGSGTKVGEPARSVFAIGAGAAQSGWPYWQAASYSNYGMITLSTNCPDQWNAWRYGPNWPHVFKPTAYGVGCIIMDRSDYHHAQEVCGTSITAPDIAAGLAYVADRPGFVPVAYLSTQQYVWPGGAVGLAMKDSYAPSNDWYVYPHSTSQYGSVASYDAWYRDSASPG